MEVPLKCYIRAQSSSHTKGYQAMGSFHSENVDVLMLQNDDIYKDPDLPFDPSYAFTRGTRDFLIDQQNWTFLNHGAFGGSLRCGYERAEQWRYYLEQQPLRYFDRVLLPHLVYSARRLADFCQASREALTLIPNVTYGLNTVLRGYVRTYKEQAHVLLWDTSYGSLKKMAQAYCNHVTEIPVSNYFDRFMQLDDPSVVFDQALEDTLDSLSGPFENALLVLDHTTSNTALNMPLERLSKFAKEKSMLVMVDAAHALLAQPVSLRQLPHVDFYLANGHKWLSCPRGIGVLYCPISELRETVLEYPAVLSHGVSQGYQSRFLWDGCRDYAAALSIPAVLDYWQTRGVDNVQKQMRDNLHQGVRLLTSQWKLSPRTATLAPLQVHSPMMALVRLPEHLQRHDATSDDAKEVQDYLYDQHIEVPIKCVCGTLYVRISCHVYNEINEYEKLAEALVDMGTS